MKLHFLDARGALTNIHDWLHQCLTETHEKVAGVMPLQPLDVVVETGKRIIPEKGHLGCAPKPGVVFITVDPDNPALKANVDASLERMFAHGLHHAARFLRQAAQGACIYRCGADGAGGGRAAEDRQDRALQGAGAQRSGETARTGT